MALVFDTRHGSLPWSEVLKRKSIYEMDDEEFEDYRQSEVTEITKTAYSGELSREEGIAYAEKEYARLDREVRSREERKQAALEAAQEEITRAAEREARSNSRRARRSAAQAAQKAQRRAEVAKKNEFMNFVGRYAEFHLAKTPVPKSATLHGLPITCSVPPRIISVLIFRLPLPA
jgi:hypothetical protein